MADFRRFHSLHKGLIRFYQHLSGRALIGAAVTDPEGTNIAPNLFHTSFACGIIIKEFEIVGDIDYNVSLTLVDTNGLKRVHLCDQQLWWVSCTRLYISSVSGASPDRFMYQELTVSAAIDDLLGWLHDRLTTLTIECQISWPVSLAAVFERINLGKFTGPLCIAPFQFLDGGDFTAMLLSNLERHEMTVDKVSVVLFFEVDDLSNLGNVAATTVPLLEDSRLDLKLYFAFKDGDPVYEEIDAFMQTLPIEFTGYIGEWVYSKIFLVKEAHQNDTPYRVVVIQCLRSPRLDFFRIPEQSLNQLPFVMAEFKCFSLSESYVKYHESLDLINVAVAAPIQSTSLLVQNPKRNVLPWLHPGLESLSITNNRGEDFEFTLEEVLSRVRLYKFVKMPIFLDVLRFPDGDHFVSIILKHLDKHPTPASKVRIHIRVIVEVLQHVRIITGMLQPLAMDRRVKGKLVFSVPGNVDVEDLFDKAGKEFRIRKKGNHFYFKF